MKKTSKEQSDPIHGRKKFNNRYETGSSRFRVLQRKKDERREEKERRKKEKEEKKRRRRTTEKGNFRGVKGQLAPKGNMECEFCNRKVGDKKGFKNVRSLAAHRAKRPDYCIEAGKQKDRNLQELINNPMTIVVEVPKKKSMKQMLKDGDLIRSDTKMEIFSFGEMKWMREEHVCDCWGIPIFPHAQQCRVKENGAKTAKNPIFRNAFDQFF